MIMVVASCCTLLSSAAVLRAGDKPLPTRSDFTIGTLDNGLTYAIKEHQTPPGWVAIRLLEKSGSLNEDEDQRGLAHFFEHLAFNGSDHFPAGTLVPTFEKLGVQFGQNLNASTGFDRTLFMVNLPKNDAETIRTGLLWTSDVAFHIGLSPEEIEKERGVILEEYRTGLGASERIQKKMWAAMMPGALLPQRWPIGLEKVIKGANRERLERYYNTWYRPNKMTIMVVGDVKTDEILPVIRELFNQPSRDKGQNAQDHTAGVTPYEDQMAIVVTDPEFVGCDLDLTHLDSEIPPVTTVDTFRQRQILNMASYIFSRRMDNLIAGGGMPFRTAQAAVSPVFGAFSFSSAGVSCDPDQWSDSLSIIAQETKRIYQYGAVESELDRAKKAVMSQMKAFAAREDTLPSQSIAGMVINQFNSGDTPTSAAQQVKILEKIQPGITIDDINKVYKHYFNPEKMAVTLTLPEKEGVSVPTEDALLTNGQEALSKPVDPYTEEDASDSLMTTLPIPGRIADKHTDEGLDITTVRFADNVLAHYKFNDFTKKTVTVTIAIEGGEIEETAETRGLTNAAVAAWNQSATSKLSSSQIQDLMSDKNITVRVGGRGGADRDSVTITVSGLPEDLEAGMQLAYLLLTDPIVEDSAFQNWVDANLEEIKGRQFNQIAQLRHQLNLARTDDPRYKLLTKENVDAITKDRVADWMKHLIADSPIEVSVVGDMTYDEVIPLLARYLGSLPARPAVGSVADQLRNITVKEGPQNLTGYFTSKEDKAFGFIAFRGANKTDVKNDRLLNVAASILSTRMTKEIREERSIVYSIGVANVSSDVYPDLGMFYAASMCASGNADELVQVAQEMYDTFAKEGPTDDEVKTALAQITANLDRALKMPAYWSRELSHFAMRHGTMEALRDPVEFYNKEVTADAIHDTFAHYYTPKRIITVKVLPKSEDNNAEEAGDKG